mmetsp:Transcript_139129/g.196969  ORF Transcript_139129/g.196969 Transcript_139129/m.196969 type:complete len:256 (-) Transcript_139129:533-1300(-)
MHMDTTPTFLPCLFNSGNKEAICREPVQPRGWPRAMAPPLGFTFSIGIFRWLMLMKACEANASLISKMSTSLTLKPACLRAGGMAYAGPMPITCGSTPTAANDRKRAKIGNPSSFAFDLRANSTRAAPSDNWDAFPAVVLPPSLNAGFIFDNASTVVPGRGPSSLEMTTSFLFPSLSVCVALIGMISLSNKPSFCAFSAFSWDASANLSWVSLEMLYFSATFSEVMPMLRMHAFAIAFFMMFGDSFFWSYAQAIG